MHHGTPGFFVLMGFCLQLLNFGSASPAFLGVEKRESGQLFGAWTLSPESAKTLIFTFTARKTNMTM